MANTVPGYGLGRVPITDGRDTNFLMRSIMPRTLETDRTWRYWWAQGWWGNQGNMPHCVAYAWLHYMEDGPVTWHPRTPGASPLLLPDYVYREAQKVDEWAGENYDGTSVRAGAKIMQQHGYISAYRWAWDLDTVVYALLEEGPVVLGTWWYRSMFDPDADGIIRISGSRAGGHAYVANGVNVERGMMRFKNSWGRRWGKDGYFWMAFEDVERLINEDGEACLATETIST